MIIKTLAVEHCKVTAAHDGKLTFVISHEAPDLVGDVVMQRGLMPVSDRLPAQVDHSGRMADVIGHWENLQVVGQGTQADLVLVPEGISPMADLVRALSDAGVKLAASIGFISLEEEKIKPKGYKFLKTQLVEVSVVVVPCQPLALQIAKSLRINESTIVEVIGQPLTESQQRAIKRAAAAVLISEALCHENVSGTNQGGPIRRRGS